MGKKSHTVIVILFIVSLLAVPSSAKTTMDAETARNRSIDLCIELPFGINVGCDSDDDDDANSREATPTPSDVVTTTPDIPTSTPTPSNVVTATPDIPTSTPTPSGVVTATPDTPTSTPTQTVQTSTPVKNVIETETEEDTDWIDTVTSSTEAAISTPTASRTETSIDRSTHSRTTDTSESATQYKESKQNTQSEQFKQTDLRTSQTRSTSSPTPESVPTATITEVTTTIKTPTAGIKEGIPTQVRDRSTITDREHTSTATKKTIRISQTKTATAQPTTIVDNTSTKTQINASALEDRRSDTTVDESRDLFDGWTSIGYWERSFAVLGGIGLVGFVCLRTMRSSAIVRVRRRNSLPDRIWWFIPIGYSRWDDDDPLEHDTRIAIASAVTEQPGRTVAEMDELGESVGYHARILVFEDVLIAEKRYGTRRFFPRTINGTAMSTAEREVLHVQQSETMVPIFDAVCTHDGELTVRDIADHCDHAPSTISTHLNTLVENGLLTRERVGQEVFIHLQPTIRDVMANDYSGPI